MPWDYALYQYRQALHLSWSDLTGAWPQPRWRTYQDLWYHQVAAEAQRNPRPARGQGR